MKWWLGGKLEADRWEGSEALQPCGEFRFDLALLAEGKEKRPRVGSQALRPLQLFPYRLNSLTLFQCKSRQALETP